MTNPANKTNHNFSAKLQSLGRPLTRDKTTTLQINVGKLCNQACLHCHVEAGPKRTEIMDEKVANQLVSLMSSSPSLKVVDLTGGAPEMNSHFRTLVEAARQKNLEVIDRCNLTVLFEPNLEWVAEFLAKNQVRVVASLPCYTKDNVEEQRGLGVFDKSIGGLKLLNSLGYGMESSGLFLDLVYNPVGTHLPPEQSKLQADYKTRLAEDFGIQFNNLLTITNMPIKRFAHQLHRDGKYQEYMDLLVQNFNIQNLDGVMCRNLISVGYDGQLYDCDFNQMLEIDLGGNHNSNPTVFDITSFDEMTNQPIAVDNHCFGCTAGAGSSCSGALA